MSLRAGKVNVLNVLNLRRVLHPPHHFHYSILEKHTPNYLKEINKWIYFNLNHRYYLGQTITLVNNQLIYATKIGFEQEKELSFFKLACPLEIIR